MIISFSILYLSGYLETLKCLFNGTKLQVFTHWWLQVGAACDSDDGDTVRDMSRGVRYVTLCHAHTILYIITTGHGMLSWMCTGVIKPSYWHSEQQHWILGTLTIFASIRNFDHHITLWTSSHQFDNHFWSVSSLLIVTFLGLESDQVWWFCWNLNQESLILSSVHLEYTHKITKLDNNKSQAWKPNYKSISKIFHMIVELTFKMINMSSFNVWFIWSACILRIWTVVRKCKYKLWCEILTKSVLH